MVVFATGIGLFLFGFGVHWMVWRTARPKATALTLIWLLVVSILLGMAALWLGSSLNANLKAWLPQTAGAWAQGTLMGLAIAAAYVMYYPALEVEIPTLEIIKLVARAGPEGIERAALYQFLDDRVLVLARIEDLAREDLVRSSAEAGGRYVLTEKGHRLAALFIMWRRILGAQKGG